MVLQGVGTLFEFRDLKEQDIDFKGYRFLFVGRGIDQAKLSKEISDCSVVSE